LLSSAHTLMCEMDRNEKRAVIKYLTFKGLSAVEISTELNSVLGDNAPSDATIYRWIAEFQRGRKSTEDEHRSGRPVDMCTDENVQRVNDMITTDRRLTVRYVAECLNLSYGTTHHVITDVLGYSKVCARWVPRMLTPENKQVRLTTSRDNLRQYNVDPAKFLRRYVTMDETWAHHFDPETKQQSKQWKHVASPPPVKFRKIASADKVLASVFWDSKGVLMIDYLERGKTVTGVYYAELIHKLRSAIKEKRRGKLSDGVLLHHDNAPAHTSAVAVATVRECGFELLSHPPYSPDLAPSDYHVFRSLKDSLRGQRFGCDEEVIHATNDWFELQDEKFFVDGVKSLAHRWEKCVALEGNYVEKL